MGKGGAVFTQLQRGASFQSAQYMGSGTEALSLSLVACHVIRPGHVTYNIS